MRPLVGLLALSAAGCSPLAHDWPDRQDYPILEADSYTAPDEDPQELRVIAWNVKYGAARLDFWFDGFGDRVIMTEEEVIPNLENMAEVLAAFDADVVMMEEIEVASKRSAYVDMVDWFLNESDLGYNYAAYVPNWQVAYVPDHGLGQIDMGNALFSKYPITRNTRIALEKIGDQDALTQLFYLDRCILEGEIELPDRTLTVLVNHPDAYSTDGTKLRQLDETFAEATSIEGDVLIGGDLNVLPPGSLRLSGFADESDVSGNRGVGSVDYEGEQDVLVPWYETWDESSELDHGDGRLTLAQYMAATTEEEQQPWMSHSLDAEVGWTQRLDYLFSNLTWRQGWVVQGADDGPDELPTLPQDPLYLSDHAPVWGVLELP